MRSLVALIVLLLCACGAGGSDKPQPSAIAPAVTNASQETLVGEDSTYCAQLPASAKSPPIVNPILGGPCTPPKVESPTTVIIVAPEILTWDEGNWDEEVWK